MITHPQQGFTLVEMIMVIVITGIIGGMVAVFLRWPVQQYMDVGRRADMTDIADTALRRINRDLRLAVPNSIRVTGGISGAGACNGGEVCYMEFIPSTGGGRYRDATDALGNGDILDFSIADTTFDVLGNMAPNDVGDQIVVYNLGIPGADAYEAGTVRRPVSAPPAAGVISIASAAPFPFDSCVYDGAGWVIGGCRFQVAQFPVTYVCDPTAGNNRLSRWQEGVFAAMQPTAMPPGEPVLANNVTACAFTYAPNVVAQRSGLVSMNLSITRDNETVTLYNAVHVSNVP